MLITRIERVTVYRRGALVERVADLAADVEGEVPVGPLPLAVVPGSLRLAVEAAGPPPVTAAGVRLAVGAPGGTGPADLAAVHAARLAEARAEAVVTAVEESIARVRALGTPVRPVPADGGAPQPVPVDGRLAVLEFRDAEVEVLLAELVAARAAARAAVQDRREAEARAATASTDREPRPDELRAHAVVALDRAAPGPALLRLSYLVPGAAWVPSYAVELDPALRRGTLTVRAAVAQRSGEDWSGVALTVATALPQRWVDLPEPRALRIGRRRGPVPPAWRPLPDAAATLHADYDATRLRTDAGAPSAGGPGAPPGDGRTVAVSLMSTGGAPAGPMPTAGGATTAVPLAAPADLTVRGPVPPAPPVHVAPPGPPPPSGRAPKTLPRAAFAAEAAPVPPPVPPPPAEPVPDPALLDYAALRLPAPDAPGRGTLRPAPEDLPAAAAEARAAAERVPAAPPGRAPLAPAAFDHAWTADRPVELPSDGRFHVVALAGHPLAVTATHVAVPREAPHAWQVVEAVNPLGTPLPAGPADVTVGGVHRLTAQVADTPPGAPLRLGLGVDEAVKVARHVRFGEEDVGLVRSRRRLRTEVTVEVANRRGEAIRLEVRERVPVARTGDDRVTVRDEHATPGWEPWPGEHDDLHGGRRWRVTVDAGATANLVAGYTVDLQSGHELVGGNRREP